MPARKSSPIWLVLIGIVSVQLGAGVAKSIFDDIDPTALVWLRLASSSVIFMLIARPRLRGRSRDDWLVVLGFAASLALMNWAIYQSFARIPLGIAVTIEFIGPLTLAVLGSRRLTDLVWVALAGIGVAVLGFEGGEVTLAGVLFALLAGFAWASYILLSARTGSRWDGLDGLVTASALAMLMLTPFAIGAGGDALLDPRILMVGLAIGLLSSVVPYSCELIALRRISPSVFGILMSLEPGAAALVGMLVLSEFLSPAQWLALVFVVVASVGATRSRATITAPVPD